MHPKIPETTGGSFSGCIASPGPPFSGELIYSPDRAHGLFRSQGGVAAGGQPSCPVTVISPPRFQGNRHGRRAIATVANRREVSQPSRAIATGARCVATRSAEGVSGGSAPRVCRGAQFRQGVARRAQEFLGRPRLLGRPGVFWGARISGAPRVLFHGARRWYSWAPPRAPLVHVPRARNALRLAKSPRFRAEGPYHKAPPPTGPPGPQAPTIRQG